MNTAGALSQQGFSEELTSSTQEAHSSGSFGDRGSTRPIVFQFENVLCSRARSKAAT